MLAHSRSVCSPRLTLALCLHLSLLPTGHADDYLDEVLVTATRFIRPEFEVPAAIDVVDVTRQRDNSGTNLSDYLSGIAGVSSRARENRAQDEQLSVRGFGARAQFGIVGVRIYVDGIPATMPDGQGQVSHVNFDSAERIEVLRGAFSSQYGNASGGVLQIYTQSGREADGVRATIQRGSASTHSNRLNVAGVAHRLAYNIDYSNFSTDGLLRYTRARRDSGNLRLDFQPAVGNQLMLVANHLSSPDAQDNGALTRSQFDSDPMQAAPTALQFQTRKHLSQSQAGIRDQQSLGNQTIQWSAYAGKRSVMQFLATPVAAQSNPLSAGGVVDLANRYSGADLQWQLTTQLLDSPLVMIAGSTYDLLRSERRGYENFVGSTLGVVGNLRRDETNRLHNFDQYLQIDWTLSPRWSVLSGVRRNALYVDSRDRYITASNPDDGGQTQFAGWTPSFSIANEVGNRWHLYASYGQSIDSPTFANLAYRPDGSSGLNLSLQAARTANSEAGAKFRSNTLSMNIAVFHSSTRNELAVASSQGGRSTYRNAGRTQRRGVEFSVHFAPTESLQGQIAYTWLKAQYLDSFRTCTVSGCSASAGLTVAAGNRIPGIARHTVHGSLQLRHQGWNMQIDTSAAGRILVNDTNTEYAAGFGVAGVQASYQQSFNRWTGRAMLRLDNLLNKRYVSTVVINDANERYFQAGAGRNLLAGVTVEWR